MSDFYALDPQAQAERLRALAASALPRWGIAPAELAVLKMRENAVFRVSLASGERYALRIHRHGYHGDAQLRSELQWLQALAHAGIDVPEVIPAADGSLFVVAATEGVPEPRQIDLFRWIGGTQLGAAESGVGIDRDAIESTFRSLGALAAALHNQSQRWRLPPGFTRHAWDADALVGERPFWGPFWELAALSVHERALILRARAVVAEALGRTGRSPEHYGLIHADLTPENVMVDGGRLRILDFDDAGFGWYLFELATALYFHRDTDYFDRAREALVAGYRGVRPLPDAAVARLPLFLLARGFTYLGWVHTRYETQTARELTPTLVRLACTVAEDYLSSAEPRAFENRS
jgi:Ser/Thr protein kinase RdoA (MazF antagonist)